MDFSQFDRSVREYMLLEDQGLLKLIMAILVASKMPIVPPWIMIVGASSGGKSMILNGIKDIPGVVKIDDLTTNTFLSGMKGSDKSLLHTLPMNPILCFSDFTTIIAKNKEVRGEVFGQMRRIWDGDMHKKTGSGSNKTWEGKAVVLGAVTTKIYSVLPEMADMGERLILYHYKMPNRKKVSKFAIHSMDDKSNEKALRKLFSEYFKQLVIPTTDLPKFSDALEDELIDLAELASRARSSIERDQYDRAKAQQIIHDLEMPIRILKTIIAVATGMAVINNSSDLPVEDKQTLYRLALDSIPINRKKVLNIMTEYDNQKSEDIQVRLNMDKGVIDRTLQDLNSLEVVNKYKGTGSGWTWQLKQEYRELLAKFEGIIMKAEEIKVVDEKPPSELPVDEVPWDKIIIPPEQKLL